ncbi:MAG: DUF3857 domain-containing protein [Bdellovibrionales bacterium]|jgi:hypothetical protein|nr:DUF3857 domain-containing protein [Bdellovibrionales bacterium]
MKIQRIYWVYIGLFLSMFFFIEEASARLPKDSDLSALMESEVSEFDIRKDGTYTVEYSVRIAILSEAGRESEAVKTVSFNSRSSKFELLEAKTINDDREIKVASSNIEIKEVGDSMAFDSMKEAIISFPAVRVGSKIVLRYRLRVREIPIEGFFSTGLNIQLGDIDLFRRVIRSELPLYVSTHDEMELLDVKSKQDGRKHIVEISNKKPIRLGVVQEDSPFVEIGRLPSVIVSTKENWSGFASAIISEQERLLADPLPPALARIRDQVKAEPTSRRMAVLAGLIAEEFRYFGDWRRRRGGHVPRSLREVVETEYGDCKDMSLAIVAIARSLGLKADIAWIWRSELAPDESYYRLPNDYGFNHAVARVEDGAVQWIDATNPVATPGLIQSDIGDRPALVLRKSGSVLERTPRLRSEDAVSKVDLTLRVRGGQRARAANQVFDLQGRFTQSGRAAVRAEMALLYSPREQIEYQTARWLSRNERLEGYEITLPEKPSRVVRDFVVDAKFSIADLGLNTTAGVGFPLLRSEIIDLMLIDTRDRFSDIWLGAPGVYEETYRILGAKVVGQRKIACDLKFAGSSANSSAEDMIRLKRTISSNKQGVVVTTRHEVLKTTLSNRDLRTENYTRFQNQVRECFNRSAVILSWN